MDDVLVSFEDKSEFAVFDLEDLDNSFIVFRSTGCRQVLSIVRKSES
jgi:hypothetical protein